MQNACGVIIYGNISDSGITMKKLTSFTLIVLLLFVSTQVLAVNNKVVIQVSSDDPVTQKIALNNAAQMQKAVGIDNIDIEIVAYGPGLSMLTQKSPESKRVASLAMQDIKFSACGNTIRKATEKNGGKAPALTEGVEIVPAGAVRIMELQQQGFAYLRP
jgi:intracellular sulfur oxidation DsrE/DsrF family protein